MNSALSGQRVVVTGASGFIGTHLCRRLITVGAEVHGISRAPRKGGTSGVRWWQADVADTASIREALGRIRPAVLYHLAGHTSAARDAQLVIPILRSTLLTTVNLLAAASEMDCQRIVLAGSLEEPEDHGGEVVPSSPYAAAKWASSGYARMFWQLFSTPVVMTRIFMVYGPGQEDRLKLVPYVIGRLLQGVAPTLGSGRRLVDWIYVEDVVEGLLRAGDAPQLEGRTVDLGSGTLVPVREMVAKLVRLMGSYVEPLFGALPDRPNERERAADSVDAYAKLRWKPTTSLDVGLALTVDWCREHRDSPQETVSIS